MINYKCYIMINADDEHEALAILNGWNTEDFMDNINVEEAQE